MRSHALLRRHAAVALSALLAFGQAHAQQAVELEGQKFEPTAAVGGQNLSLRTELDLARKYVEIEQVRFGDRLRVEWSVDDSLLDGTDVLAY